ncbi:hypothetical protein, partial [Curtobacterium sp. MCBA15_016]
QVRPVLEAAIEHARSRTGSRSPFLRWATNEREVLRVAELERDVHLQGVRDINERLVVAEQAVASFDAARRRAEEERDTIALRYDELTRSAEYRLLHRFGGLARAVRRGTGRG